MTKPRHDLATSAVYTVLFAAIATLAVLSLTGCQTKTETNREFYDVTEVNAAFAVPVTKDDTGTIIKPGCGPLKVENVVDTKGFIDFGSEFSFAPKVSVF